MSAGTLYNPSPVLLRLRTWSSERGLKSLLLKGFCMVFEMMERDRQRRELATLDDRMLSDIGVSRSDVAREINKAPWQP